MFSSNQFKKKHSIKVPKTIKVLYCDKKNIVTFIGSSQTKSLKLKVKIFLDSISNTILVTDISVADASAIDLKNIKKIQGTTVAKINQMLIEVTYTLYQKLNLVGVGYRAFSYEKLENQLYFKLGYSHLIYYPLQSELQFQHLNMYLHFDFQIQLLIYQIFSYLSGE